MQSQLVQDLAGAVRSAFAGDEETTPAARLSILEDEHRRLSDRRQRLRESIDLLEGFDVLRPDAAARLEKYRSTEQEVSRQRRDVAREIDELRLAGQRAHRHPM
jgi:hypothetical protein